jgi:hypothetical protein
MPDQPNELAGELRGVADHFMSWDALVIGALVAASRLGPNHFVFGTAGGFKGA